jgi:prepilin peptidase CpaA
LDKYFLIGALAIASVGAVKDVYGRRIPNWLTYSGILAGLMARGVFAGWPGLKGGLLGVLLAGGIFYLLFLLGGMGGGDVKLVAAVGAWAGTIQAGSVLIVAALAGGVLAVCYIVMHRQVRETLLNTMELVRHHATEGLQPHPVLNVQQPGTMRLPYGLAIAIGTLYCVGNAFWWR